MKNLNKNFTLMLLGRSGCGKGTQARMVLERLKKTKPIHFETGQHLRRLLKTHHNATIEIGKKLMGQGRFFPYWMVDYLLVREVVEKGATKRLLGRGRKDDKTQLIKNRMEFFKTDVLPVIDFYRKERRLIEVDGSKPAQEVFFNTDKALL